MSNLPPYVFIVDEEMAISDPAKEGDVGYDVIASSEPVIVGKKNPEGYWKNIDYIEYDLMIKIDGFQPVNSNQADVFTLVFPRSSISKYNLLLCNSVGVVDSGYRGNVKVRFKYLFQPEDLKVSQMGNVCGMINSDKFQLVFQLVCQLVFQQHFHPLIELFENLEESERNEGGFGSTNL